MVVVMVAVDHPRQVAQVGVGDVGDLPEDIEGDPVVMKRNEGVQLMTGLVSRNCVDDYALRVRFEIDTFQCLQEPVQLYLDNPPQERVGLLL